MTNDEETWMLWAFFAGNALSVSGPVDEVATRAATLADRMMEELLRRRVDEATTHTEQTNA